MQKYRIVVESDGGTQLSGDAYAGMVASIVRGPGDPKEQLEAFNQALVAVGLLELVRQVPPRNRPRKKTAK